MSMNQEPNGPVLPADVVRCLGGGCGNASACRRYLGRNDKLEGMSFISGGAFMAGVCLYMLPGESPEPSRPAASQIQSQP